MYIINTYTKSIIADTDIPAYHTHTHTHTHTHKDIPGSGWRG